jgi:hypothetical protein
VDLVSPHVHRALAYLRLLNDRGIDPAREHLEAFACEPSPQDAVYQTSFLNVAAFGQWLREQKTRNAEPVVDYLVRMGWVELSAEPEGRVHLTDLGQVVLLGLGAEGPAEQILPNVADVVLEPTDPMAWVHLTRVVANAGAGMLVDGYFKADFVPWLVETTTMRRVLVSSRPGKAAQDLGLIAVALATLPNAGQLEVRATNSPELHDRCIIGADGTVQLLGSSVNGVGRNMTAVVRPDPDVMRTYRDRYENLWKSATVVEPQPPAGGPPAVAQQQPTAPSPGR